MFKRIKCSLYRLVFFRILPKYLKRTAIFPLDDSVSMKIKDLRDKINKKSTILQNFDGTRMLAVMSIYAQRIAGDIVEVGCYKGGSAKIICEFKGKKALHLFDTFEGHPVASQFVPDRHPKGRFAVPLKEVKEYLTDYKEVYFYKGVFPNETSTQIKDKTFSLVHLDLDLAEGIMSSLEFFYPRMNKGGIILIHDYSTYLIEDVNKVVDKFFSDKPEPVIQITSRQALIIKL